MARYRTYIDSPASAEDVFAYLADFQTVAEWDPGVRSARLIHGEPAAVGARYFVVAGFLGRGIPLEYEVVHSAPPADRTEGRVELEAHTSDFRSYDVITVAPTEGGCRVTYDADLALKGFRRPFDPLLALSFRVIGNRARHGLATALASAPVA